MDIESREKIPDLLNRRGLTGKGAEIGVAKGHYSKVILERWKGELLYSIDAWPYFEDRRGWLKATFENLSGFGERSKIIKATSEYAAKNSIKDRELDFVYIDASHYYRSVKNDLSIWWSKVKEGGMISGHDYLDGETVWGEFSVKSAVDEFVEERNLDLYLTGENQDIKSNITKSWFFFKQK